MTAKPGPHLLVVDDHPLVRLGLVRAVEQDGFFTQVSTAGNRQEALARLEADKPMVVLVDLLLPDVNGVDLIRELRSRNPSVRIVAFSAHPSESNASLAVAAGALCFLSKAAPTAEVIADLKQAACSRTARTSSPPSPSPALPSADLLTARELTIFQLIGRGKSTREIAAVLGISFKTVETHRENIKNKLGLPHSLALMQQATKWVEQG